MKIKVAVWHNNKDIRIQEVPTPKPGPKEMLVKVHSCGICGSDIVEWYRLPRAPLVQGHEIGAEVIEAGETVKSWRPGNRVMIAPKVPCMKCSYCMNGHHPVCPNVKERLPGGFAEYILVPEILLEKGTYRLPEGIDYDRSTFIEPLACVVRAQRLAGVAEGRSVLVLGCGMSGLLHIKLAAAKKCRITAVDINKKRLELAKRFGAETVIDAAENAPERKADTVILCTAAPSAVDQAWKSVDKGGCIVFFAVPGPDTPVAVPINTFWTQEIRIITSYYCGPSDITEAMDLLDTRRIEVDDLITHRLPLGEIEKGFRLVIEGRESIKVIIRPGEGK